MKKLAVKIGIILSITAFVCSNNILAQCSLTFQNPSFEGTTGMEVTPPNWTGCLHPDTQPGSFGITLPASNGSSYVGLMHNQSTGWKEGINQTLSNPMIANTTYYLTMDLATTNSTVGGLIPGCIEIQIWGNMGGSSGCTMQEFLWKSDTVTNLTWQTYNVSFTPTQNWTHFLLMSHNLGCAVDDEPYIMVDNIQYDSCSVSVNEYTNENINIYPNPANDNVTITLNNNMLSGTSLAICNISGQLIEEIALNNKKTDVDISNLAKGIYILKVMSNEGLIIKKLIKE